MLKEERNYILQMIKKIRASGANVVLIQKSILRDAVTDLSLHYLVPPRACPQPPRPARHRAPAARAGAWCLLRALGNLHPGSLHPLSTLV